MKYLIPIALIAFAFSACDKKHPLQGTWQRFDTGYYRADTIQLGANGNCIIGRRESSTKAHWSTVDNNLVLTFNGEKMAFPYSQHNGGITIAWDSNRHWTYDTVTAAKPRGTKRSPRPDDPKATAPELQKTTPTVTHPFRFTCEPIVVHDDEQIVLLIGWSDPAANFTIDESLVASCGFDPSISNDDFAADDSTRTKVVFDASVYRGTLVYVDQLFNVGHIDDGRRMEMRFENVGAATDKDGVTFSPDHFKPGHTTRLSARAAIYYRDTSPPTFLRFVTSAATYDRPTSADIPPSPEPKILTPTLEAITSNPGAGPNFKIVIPQKNAPPQTK